MNTSSMESREFIATSSKLEWETSNSISIMPINGDIRIWYGVYTDTDANLRIHGMPIKAGSLYEHKKVFSGTISIISETTDVIIHEVI